MRTTLRDVAQAAGVSTMAASVVLNGTGHKKVTVSPEKAERIRQVAKELRYQPNRLARSLRNQRTHQVGVVFQRFSRIGSDHPYHTAVLNGVIAALFPEKYTLSLCPEMNEDRNAGTISDGRFDGILWCRPEFTPASLEAIQRSTVPVVMMHVPPGKVHDVPIFCADNDSAMRRVVEHLKSLGHQRIAFLIDPWSVHTVEGNVRGQALVTAALRAGLPKPDVIVFQSDHSMLARYATDDAPHTALVCFSDELAGIVLGSCPMYGVSVPEHISVVGFDSSPFCETTHPRLTSVSQPVEQIAYAATSHLLSLIRSSERGQSKAPVSSHVYDCPLDVRDSTGPARRLRLEEA